MGAEKELEPSHGKGFTHVVQATDKLGRVVSRDPFGSAKEAEDHAAKLRKEGHSVEVSAMDASRTEGLHPPNTPTG